MLRFNFRGTGLSAGTHDEGRGERDDVRTALAWLKSSFGLPVIFAGFSFGAAVGTRVACADPDVPAHHLAGHAGSRRRANLLLSVSWKNCRKPKLFLSGDHDEFGPHDELERIVANAAEPKELVFVPGDHYFAGHLDEMRLTIESWLAELFSHNP